LGPYYFQCFFLGFSEFQFFERERERGRESERGRERERERERERKALHHPLTFLLFFFKNKNKSSSPRVKCNLTSKLVTQWGEKSEIQHACTASADLVYLSYKPEYKNPI
jgi:hypothetical protein